MHSLRQLGHAPPLLLAVVLAITVSAPARSAPSRAAGVPLVRMVGQMLMIGVPGTTLDPQTASLIQRKRIGNAVYLKNNASSPTQLRALSSELQSAAKAANGLPTSPPMRMATLSGMDPRKGTLRRAAVFSIVPRPKMSYSFPVSGAMK